MSKEYYTVKRVVKKGRFVGKVDFPESNPSSKLMAEAKVTKYVDGFHEVYVVPYEEQVDFERGEEDCNSRY